MAVQDYADLIRQNAKRYGLDPALLEASILQESSGNPSAVSPKGAIGLGQILPSTAAKPGYGVTPFDPSKPLDDPGESIRFMADYTSQMLKRFDGNIEHALAAYNWGPDATENWIKNGGKFDDLPEETRNHIDKVKAGHLSQTSGTAPDMSLTGLEDKVSTPTEELYKRTEAETAIRRASQSPLTPKGPEAPGGFFAKMGDEMEGLGKSLWASAYDVGSLLADMADFGFGDDDVTDKFAAYLQKQGEDVRETIPEWMKNRRGWGSPVRHAKPAPSGTLDRWLCHTVGGYCYRRVQAPQGREQDQEAQEDYREVPEINQGWQLRRS